MDSFDTILEQLKQAQIQGKDAVTDKIETIAEKLGALVEEARASVKETLSREADDLFPVAGLRAALEDFNRRAEKEAEEKAQLALRLQEAEEKLGGVAPSVPALSLELLRTLDRARSQSDLLRELLPALCDSVARAAVLVIRGGDVNAWSGIGFADGESLRDWRCGTADSPSLARLVADERPVSFKLGQDPVFDGWLAAEAPAGEALLIPVCLRGQLMGCVYVDDGEDGPWDPKAVQTMVAVACWMIDTLHARQAVPSPMLAEVLLLAEELPGAGAVEEEGAVFDLPPHEVAAGDEPVAELSGDDEATPVVEYGDEAAQEPDQEPEPEAEADEEPEPEPDFEPDSDSEPETIDDTEDEEMASAAVDFKLPESEDFDPSATIKVEVAPEFEEVPPAVHEQETVIEEEPVPPPVPEEEPSHDAQVAPALPVTPPPPVEITQPAVASEMDLSPEEAAQHDEARRFARLLISEIKLYNEEEVDRGRLSKDIYLRLREDIDRSREMYEKRISETVRQVTDYFDEELVRILAEGDADALGM